MRPLQKHYVYILGLSNKTYYTGSTSNFERRLNEHKLGQERTTKKYLPIKLITFLGFTSKEKALKFEKYLKTGSGFAFRNKRLV